MNPLPQIGNRLGHRLFHAECEERINFKRDNLPALLGRPAKPRFPHARHHVIAQMCETQLMAHLSDLRLTQVVAVDIHVNILLKQDGKRKEK